MARLRGYFEVARWDTAVYVRVVGLANFNNSYLFQDFVDEMLGRGYTRFFVDLRDCQGFDSTFMGVMLGVHLYQPQHGSPGAEVVVVNAGPHHRKLLGDLGLDSIISIVEDSVCLPAEVRTERLGEERYEPKARIELIRKAHENLVALDESNREKFGPFLEALSRELDSGD